MDIKQTEKLCESKEKESMEKYYGNLVREAAIERHEEI